MKKALVFVNAKASQAEGSYEQIAAALTSAGLQPVRAVAQEISDYARLVKEHCQEVDLAVAVGGDGTVCCVAEAICSVVENRLPLGIIPMGTANNVARSLGVPLTIEGACGVIAEGLTAPMDLGRVNGRLFVSVAGLGLSTRLHSEVPAELKKRWGWVSYALYTLKLLRGKLPTFRAQIKFDQGELNVKALQITVCNGRFYGAHLQVHPEASLSEGLLDLSVIEAKNYIKGFFKALLPFRRPSRSPGISALRAKKFEIITRPPTEIHVEGTTDLHTPASFEVIPSAITVFVPKDSAR